MMSDDLFESANNGDAWATQKADLGIAQSSIASGEDWKDYALRFLKDYLGKNSTLFCDDLWAAGLDEPASPRALGAVIQSAARSGWIREMKVDGCILAKRSKLSNMQLKRVWKSELY